MHKNDNIAKLKTDREVLIVALQMAKDYLEDQELDEALLKTIQTTLALVNSKTDTESFSNYTSLVLLFRIALYGAGWGESLTPVSIPCAGVFGANG